jgi:hypothetical protein
MSFQIVILNHFSIRLLAPETNSRRRIVAAQNGVAHDFPVKTLSVSNYCRLKILKDK